MGHSTGLLRCLRSRGSSSDPPTLDGHRAPGSPGSHSCPSPHPPLPPQQPRGPSQSTPSAASLQFKSPGPSQPLQRLFLLLPLQMPRTPQLCCLYPLTPLPKSLFSAKCPYILWLRFHLLQEAFPSAMASVLPQFTAHPREGRDNSLPVPLATAPSVPVCRPVCGCCVPGADWCLPGPRRRGPSSIPLGSRWTGPQG